MSTTTDVFVEKYNKYWYFSAKEIALSGVMMFLHSPGQDGYPIFPWQNMLWELIKSVQFPFM